MKRETKDIAAAEVRFAADGDAGTFSGYASIFGEPDAHGDIIRAGAYRTAIREMRAGARPPMFWDHNQGKPIGVWTEIAEDARGLKVTGRLVTETRDGADAHALMKAGAVNGLSIGFRARKAERDKSGARVLTDIDLVEISLVALPSARRARVDSVKGAAHPASHAAFLQAARRAALIIKGTTP